MPRKRALAWVERAAAEPGEPSDWCLMHGRRVVVTVRPYFGSWWWYGFGQAGRRSDNLSLAEAKAQAHAHAEYVLGAVDRIERMPDKP